MQPELTQDHLTEDHVHKLRILLTIVDLLDSLNSSLVPNLIVDLIDSDTDLQLIFKIYDIDFTVSRSHSSFKNKIRIILESADPSENPQKTAQILDECFENRGYILESKVRQHLISKYQISEKLIKFTLEILEIYLDTEDQTEFLEKVQSLPKSETIKLRNLFSIDNIPQTYIYLYSLFKENSHKPTINSNR